MTSGAEINWDGRDAIANQAQARPSALACVDLRSGERTSYGELDRLVAQAAGLLRSQVPAPRGARIAFLGRNSLDAVILMFACERVGAIFTPLNWRLAPSELGALTQDCEPAFAIWETEFAAGAAAFTAVETVEISPDHNAFRTAVMRQEGAAPNYGGPAEAALILYTSGTTARPKGVVLSRAALHHGAANFAAVGEVDAGSAMLCDAPMFHTVGLVATTRCILQQGGTLVISDRFAPQLALQRLADPALAITHMFGVPQIVQMLCDDPAYSPSKLAGLRALFSGGAPLPQPLVERLLDEGVLLVNGYGMTETSTIVGMPLEGHILRGKAGSAGRLAPAVEMRIMRPDGREAATDEVGEIWVRGPAVTAGYWAQPEATAAAFCDGWFRTGDAGRCDRDGFLFIVDRWKDMYISGGENVYPAEVEAVIGDLSGVREVGVVGRPDPRWGEVGWAFVVAASDAGLTADDIIAHCAGRLARYKLPIQVRFVDALPRTASGKVRKDELRRMATS